jgi:hypothetical protein
VNLLHAAFFQHHQPDRLVESLLDKLTTGRVEIDLIEMKGIEFRAVDNRLMALKLVQVGLSGAAMFGPDREVLQPSEVLRKKAILVERGSFRPPTVVNIDMLEAARAKFETDPAVAQREVLLLTELTMANLRAGGDVVDRRDFLARADLLAACGMTVLISDFLAYHRLAAYLAWRTDGRIGMVMGVPSLIDLFDEATHAELPGGILESFGRLLKNDLRLFVYPMLRDGRVVTVDTVEVAEELQPAVRLPAPARQLRRARQLQARLPAHPQPRRAQADPLRGHELGGDGAAGGGRADQEARVLRLRPGTLSTVRADPRGQTAGTGAARRAVRCS